MTETTPQAKSFHIRREGDPAAGRCAADRLAAEVAGDFGPRAERPFILTAHDAAGIWVGGINGMIHWRWLYIAQFYVAPDRRGQGFGGSLLAEAEKLARENACVGLYLDTFSAGAEKFYRAHGFAVAGRIGNFPPGATRIFLSKPL